jgi:hypothetical protein
MLQRVAQYMLENCISDGRLWGYRLCSHELLWYFEGMHCFHLQGESMVEVGAEVIESRSRYGW